MESELDAELGYERSERTEAAVEVAPKNYRNGYSKKSVKTQLGEVEISPELLSKISEKIMEEVSAWQKGPLETGYPFLFLDAIHYKVKENHEYVTKDAYVVFGITIDGKKDILGTWIGEHESSKYKGGADENLDQNKQEVVHVFPSR